jgi:hypothetical protein
VLSREIDVGDTVQEDSFNLKYPDVGSSVVLVLEEYFQIARCPSLCALP